MRGFHFQREQNKWVTCKISVDPANGKPYLGVNNSAESRGYVILKRPPKPARPLMEVPRNKEVIEKRFKAQLLGSRMRSTMEAEGMGDAMEWISKACADAEIPVENVIEGKIHDGQVGRLVQLCSGGVQAKAREVVPLYHVDAFDHDDFWLYPVRAAKSTAHQLEPDASDEEAELPNHVGYRRVPPLQRPTYKGSDPAGRS